MIRAKRRNTGKRIAALLGVGLLLMSSSAAGTVITHRMISDTAANLDFFILANEHPTTVAPLTGGTHTGNSKTTPVVQQRTAFWDITYSVTEDALTGISWFLDVTHLGSGTVHSWGNQYNLPGVNQPIGQWTSHTGNTHLFGIDDFFVYADFPAVNNINGVRTIEQWSLRITGNHALGVPEPTSLAMLLVAAAALGGSQWRAQRRG